MRADIVPGATFPDYELTDHAKTRRRLSELQGIDPMILVLSRGGYCPKDHQQHLELAAFDPRSHVAYTQIVTISTDNILETNEFRDVGRRAVDVPLRRRPQGAEGPRHPGVHRPAPRPDDPAHARARAGPGHPQHLQRLLVLGPALDRGPPPRPARGDPRDPPGLGPGRPGLREAWDAGDHSMFHPYNDGTPADAAEAARSTAPPHSVAAHELRADTPSSPTTNHIDGGQP